MRWKQTDWKRKETVETQRGPSGRNPQATPRQRNLKTSAKGFHALHLNRCVNVISIWAFRHTILKLAWECFVGFCFTVGFNWKVIRNSVMAPAADREIKIRGAEKRSASGSGITTSLTSSCAARRKRNGARATVTTEQRKMATTMATPTALRWGTSQARRTGMTWRAGRNAYVIRWVRADRTSVTQAQSANNEL